MALSREELRTSLQGLFIDSTYSDLTVTCGGSEFRVHKAIVCPRSGFFARACNGKFKEAKTGEINLPEDNPETVRLVLHYLYHLDYPHIFPDGKDEESDAVVFGGGSPDWGSYPPSCERRWGGGCGPKNPQCATCIHREKALKYPNLTIHAQVYALAEKLCIESLKDLAIKKFEAEAAIHWNSDDFLQAAAVVYLPTIASDRGLRDIAIDTLDDHRELFDKDTARDLAKELDLGYDLLVYGKRKTTEKHSKTWEASDWV